MKILRRNLKKRTGWIKLKIETDNDIWHLKNVIKAGDRIRSKTLRTTIEGREKKTCTLTIEVEKVNYESKRIRTTGEIEKAPEDVEHGYHSFNLKKGKVFDLYKEKWNDYELNRIDEALKDKDYDLLVCLIDKGEASFSTITESGIKQKGDIEANISGKMYKTDKRNEKEFYGDVIKVLKDNKDKDAIILAGPGFENENLYNKIKDEDLKDKIYLQDTSVTGETGLQEVVKRGGVEQVLEDSRISREVQIIEEFLTELKKDSGKMTYGLEEIEQALEMGAIDKLIVLDEKARDESIEKMMDQVEDRSGEVIIVHADHEAGQKFKNMGGIAAFLRYQIN